ncbi:hypothetical protein DAA51_38315 [Bradyrhizobium sp. WBAH10]|nr:hypothetical protein [Bradyrhizobium sp. WBAH10]QCJ78866.1 hypothetical protein DAA51_38315 [Bradyrhizobium sp. WBAH10]QCJ86214.1 hypothetical protein DAA53_38140 [Bradyrhizobium sp. WBAH23]QCJ93587.1 hypothetical protein DAA57_38210 [Bradyrhizobium yuanmingense]
MERELRLKSTRWRAAESAMDSRMPEFGHVHCHAGVCGTLRPLEVNHSRTNEAFDPHQCYDGCVLIELIF